MEKILRATHPGTLVIGNLKIPCAVLEDGTRVLTQGGFLTAIGRSRTPKAGTGATVAEIPTFLAANNLKPFVSNDLLASTKPIQFEIGKRRYLGYKAVLLPMVCEVYLSVRDAHKLFEAQKKICARCDLIMRALAHIGIIALVDEVTGYQEVRDRLALQKILEKYLLDEYAKQWAKRFPDEFYEQMFRLKGWQWKGMKVNRPSVVGRYTNDLVYERLAPGVLDELKKRNPPDEKGHRKSKHHQWLTEDVGHPELQKHLSMLVGFERASANWQMFYRMVQRALPKLNEQIPLALEE